MKVSIIARPQIDWSTIADHLHRTAGGDGKPTSAAEGLPTSGWTRTDEILNNTSQNIIEFAGRVCYDSFGQLQGRKNQKAYIQNIIELRHFSVLEHAVYVFLVEYVSRNLTHELVRHRHLSFSQRSTRYVDESGNVPVTPHSVLNCPRALTRWQESTTRALEDYKYIVEAVTTDYPNEHNMSAKDKRKLAREAGRSVLPQATSTTIVVSGNCRAWRDFITVRNVPSAEPEIQHLAQLICELLSTEAPLLFADLRQKA